MKLTGTEKAIILFILTGIIILSFTIPKAINDIKNYMEQSHDK